WEARDVLHLAHGHARLFESGESAACGDDLPAKLNEPAGKRFDVGFVVDAEQSTHDDLLVTPVGLGIVRFGKTWCTLVVHRLLVVQTRDQKRPRAQDATRPSAQASGHVETAGLPRG